MRRKQIFALLICLLALIFATPVLAQEAYVGFTTNAWGEAVPAPAGYRVREVKTGEDMGAGSFNKPQDLFYDKHQSRLWLADTGNARVVVLDREMTFLREYTAAGEVPFVTPSGIFVSKEGLIYVADEGAGSVLCMDEDGQLIRRYDRPVSDLYEDATPYRPQKVVVDSANRVYVLSAGVYQGLLCFYEDGSFLNFFGASHVEVTAKLVFQKMWRSFMTKAQRDAMESFVPIEYANITMDDEDMIYAVVMVSEAANARALVKLNPMGINILPPFLFSSQMALIDTLPENNSLFTVLNKTGRQVIQFGVDSGGAALAFGGWGDQDGLFKTPVSMEAVGEDILILDSETGAVSAFELTAFGKAIHQATALYGQGLYQESITPWQEVLRLNNNYAMAYRGLGRAYFQLEDYERAMENYRLANDKQGYSDAFRELSLLRVRANMGYILGGIVLFFILLKLYGNYRAKRRPSLEERRVRSLRPLRMPFTLMLHPYEGFDEVKSSGAGSVRVGIGIVGLLFLSMVISYVGTGFAFNHNRLERLNVFLLLGVSLGGFLLAYVSNLAVSSLMDDCEGRTGELFIVLSHALLPAILARLVSVALSNLVNLEMGVFLNMLTSLGMMWSLVLLFMGLMQVNRLTFKRALLNLLLTVVVLVIIAALLVLLYSLYQQISVFFITMYNEVMFRI